MGRGDAWEPPRRLRYLWHLRRDRADATDVLIVFSPQGEDCCRVSIEHTGWDRLGANATAMATSQPGWLERRAPALRAAAEG